MTIHRPDSEIYSQATHGALVRKARRGVLRVTGADRLDLLHRLSTNQTRDLKSGQETTTILTSDKGRIIDVLRVFAFDDHAVVLLSRSDPSPTIAWLDRYTIMDDFAVSDLSQDFVTMGLYGGRAPSTVRSLLARTPPDAGAFASLQVDGGLVIVARDARLGGGGGFQFVVQSAAEARIGDGFASTDVIEVDEGTYQTMRIEAGQPEFGAELNEAHNPLEAGLSHFVSFRKGCYIGQEVIARLDSYDKVQRHLVGLELDGDSAEGNGAAEVTLADGTAIGEITSMAQSKGRTLALAYVRTQHAVPGSRVVARIGGAAYPGMIAKLPFDT